MAAVRELTDDDVGRTYAVINAAAEPFHGEIPEPADTRPYMPLAAVADAFESMAFYGIERDGLIGVIGIQHPADVTLIRHLYVRPADQGLGVGTQLLEAGLDRAADTVLVGTWAAADWAIEFYRANGFELVDDPERLLETYWDVPAYQRDASVVLRTEA